MNDNAATRDLTADPKRRRDVEDWAGWSEDAYRYRGDPFCPCTRHKLRFLRRAGILDEHGELTRYGQRLEYLWKTDPADHPLPECR